MRALLAGTDLFVPLEHVDELGAVFVAGLRESPPPDDLLDAGIERTELGRPVDGRVLDPSGDSDRDLHADLAVGEAVVAQQRALVTVLDPAAVAVDDPRDVGLRRRRP